MEFERIEHKIVVDLTDINSIKEALVRYRDLLIDGRAFRDEEFFQFFNIAFVNEKKEELEKENEELIKDERVKKAYNDYFSYHGKYNISETLLFAVGVQYEELKEDILATAKEIVAYARKVNDTSDMWVDDCMVFGLGALYVIGHKYPDYSYLMGSYLIPYWDDEHAPYAQELITDYTREKGINRETLKIFAYCDNTHVRDTLWGRMFSWDYMTESYIQEEGFSTPKEYFNNNKEDYEWFKETLKKRFEEQEFLHYASEFTPKPIDSFYKSLILPYSGAEGIYSESNDAFSDLFVYDNGDIEASEVEAEIIDYLGRPLVEEPKEDDEKDEYYHWGRAIEAWKEFIQEEFRNGDQIWNYIENNGDSSCLEVINPMKPEELREVLLNSEYELKKPVAYFTSVFEGIDDELHSVCMDIFYDWYEEDDNHRTDNSCGNAKLVRLIDFLFYLFGQKNFKENFYNHVVNTYELMTAEEFQDRYNTDIKGRLLSYAKGQIRYKRPIYHNELEDFYKTFSKLRRDKPLEALNTLKKLLPIDLGQFLAKHRLDNLDFLDWDFSLTNIPLVAYILAKDIEGNFMDESSRYLEEFFSKSLKPLFLRSMEEGFKDDFDKGAWKQIQEDLFQKPKMPPQELMMKLMKGGPASLTEEELKEFNEFKKQKPKDPQVVLEDMAKLLVNYKEAQYNYPKYKLGSEDGIAIVMQSIFILQQGFYNSFNSPIKIDGYSTLVNLSASLIKFAPVPFINNLSKGDRTKYEFSDKALGLINFVDKLKRFDRNIKDEYLSAWEAFYNYYINNDENNNAINSIVDILGDIDEEAESSFFGSMDKKKRENMEKGIKYLNKFIRVEYYKNLEERYEVDKPLKDEFDAAIKSYIDGTIDKNLESRGVVVASIMTYINGEVEYEEVEGYRRHLARNFNYYRGYDYEFEEAYWSLDYEGRRRLIKFYLDSNEFYHILISRLDYYDRPNKIFRYKLNNELLQERLEEILDIIEEFGGDIDLFVKNLVDDREFLALGLIHDRINIVNHLEDLELTKLIKFLDYSLEVEEFNEKFDYSYFAKHKSREVRDIIEKL